MLIECPECKRQVSDQAEACPQCGHPIRPAAVGEIAQATVKGRNAPVFLVLGSIALVLSLCTPRLLLFFPIMGTLGCAAISLLRREQGRVGGILVLVFGIGLLAFSEVGTTIPGAVGSSNLAAAEIVGWNWRKDPSFGTHGTIKWNVQIRNKSSENISSAKVEFTTFDKAGKLIATAFNYIDAIPPGQTRSGESYADLYMTEDTATVQIADVSFSR
jgi:hypothetical protein